jgi:hypothetical protein
VLPLNTTFLCVAVLVNNSVAVLVNNSVASQSLSVPLNPSQSLSVTHVDIDPRLFCRRLYLQTGISHIQAGDRASPVKRDLYQTGILHIQAGDRASPACQKRPTIVSKETYYGILHIQAGDRASPAHYNTIVLVNNSIFRQVSRIFKQEIVPLLRITIQ